MIIIDNNKKTLKNMRTLRLKDQKMQIVNPKF